MYNLSNVELLWELVENGSVRVLVLLDDGGDEGDQLVPELEVVQPRARVLRVPLSLVRVNLGLMRYKINVNQGFP